MGQGNITRAQTSVDILEERNALRTRVAELEEAMRAVLAETESGSSNPETSFLAMCRVASVARRALSSRAPGVASTRDSAGAFDATG